MIIDPGVEKILSLSFLKRETAGHPLIKRITLNGFLYALTKSCGGYCRECQTISFDASVEPGLICEAFNARFPDLNLREWEVWPRIFFHERAHSTGKLSEWTCDRIANECLLRWRKEREQKINLIFQNKLLMEG